MTKEEFIIWFKENIGELDKYENFEEQVEYEPLTYENINISDESVSYSYEEAHWGYTDYIRREGTFDDFVTAANQTEEKGFYSKRDYIKYFGHESN